MMPAGPPPMMQTVVGWDWSCEEGAELMVG